MFHAHRDPPPPPDSVFYLNLRRVRPLVMNVDAWAVLTKLCYRVSQVSGVRGGSTVHARPSCRPLARHRPPRRRHPQARGALCGGLSGRLRRPDG